MIIALSFNLFIQQLFLRIHIIPEIPDFKGLKLLKTDYISCHLNDHTGIWLVIAWF